jgi:ferredoxin
MSEKLYVWIDQDLCTGDGLCEEVCPDLFFGADDGLFYVKEKGEKANALDPRLKMGNGLAFVPDGLVDAAVEAAEECPGECIFFTMVEE